MPGTGRLAVAGDATGCRKEPMGGVLGVDAALERVAAGLDVLLADRQRLPCGDAHHLADEVDAADLLGDRVLHLDARVHLQEEELVARHEVLARAGGAIAHGLRGAHGRLAHALAKVG